MSVQERLGILYNELLICGGKYQNPKAVYWSLLRKVPEGNSSEKNDGFVYMRGKHMRFQ